MKQKVTEKNLKETLEALAKYRSQGYNAWFEGNGDGTISIIIDLEKENE